jgi:Cytochrome P450
MDFDPNAPQRRALDLLRRTVTDQSGRLRVDLLADACDPRPRTVAVLHSERARPRVGLARSDPARRGSVSTECCDQCNRDVPLAADSRHRHESRPARRSPGLLGHRSPCAVRSARRRCHRRQRTAAAVRRDRSGCVRTGSVRHRQRLRLRVGRQLAGASLALRDRADGCVPTRPRSRDRRRSTSRGRGHRFVPQRTSPVRQAPVEFSSNPAPSQRTVGGCPSHVGTRANGCIDRIDRVDPRATACAVDVAARVVPELHQLNGARGFTIESGLVTQFVVRIPDHDVVIGDLVFPARRRIILNLEAAVRDPQAFTDPDTFDIERPNLNRSRLPFGWGTHFCLGAALSRAAMVVAIETLTTRLTDVSIDGTVDVSPARGMLRGPDRLPVAFATR